MPNIPKGTRDFLPPEQIKREIAEDEIETIFRLKEKWNVGNF
jgi:histidyl-tRNA synthetase